jgi:hypothetical protein
VPQRPGPSVLARQRAVAASAWRHEEQPAAHRRQCSCPVGSDSAVEEVRGALAVPPTTEQVTIEDFSFVDTELCGFPVTFTEDGTFKVTTFYDDQGNPIKSILSNSNVR